MGPINFTWHVFETIRSRVASEEHDALRRIASANLHRLRLPAILEVPVEAGWGKKVVVHSGSVQVENGFMGSSEGGDGGMLVGTFLGVRASQFGVTKSLNVYTSCYELFNMPNNGWS